MMMHCLRWGVFLVLLMLAMGVSGCGLFTGADNYESYKNMYVAHAESKTARANAMTAQPCPADPVAAAYCNSAKMMGQAFISLEKFDISAPKTGYDVLYKVTDSIVPVAGFISLYRLGSDGIKNAGSQFGDNATLNHSMNHTDPNITNIGPGSASGTVTGSTPQKIGDVEWPPEYMLGE
jgi:hypothetical protein